ncbi:MAG: hypothetical protein R3351_09975 [Nitrospirales bacterium]|nr:hypothetical protein [Nitrospirales bacterium]
MKILALGIFSVILLSACSSSPEPQASSSPPPISADTPGAASTSAPNSITISKEIPYRDPSFIAENIKRECRIQEQLSEFIQAYGDEEGLNVSRADNINKDGPGVVLVVEITNALSGGNPFIGHQKQTFIAGKLYDNGKEIASFTGRRNSMGGVFGGFKGSCSVLGRTVKALGKDVANWLKDPVMGAHLGD